jgi:hypothetical protein
MSSSFFGGASRISIFGKPLTDKTQGPKQRNPARAVRLSRGSICPKPYAEAVTNFGSPRVYRPVILTRQERPASIFEVLSRTISPERLNTYFMATGRDEARALALYLWNAELGAAFHPVIQATEVALRNSVNHALTEQYGDQWWANEGPPGLLDADRTGDLSVVMRRIRNRGQQMNSGQVVAGLSFGFWVGMLQPRYNPPIWGRHLRTAFPFLPRSVARKGLAAKGQRVAFLRNRISHHEPIFSRDVSSDIGDLMTMLQWMCPATHDWIKPHCRVFDLMRHKP